jgi:hypothetical protein
MKCIEKYEDFEEVQVNQYCEFLHSEVCENCKIRCPYKDSAAEGKEVLN